MSREWIVVVVLVVGVGAIVAFFDQASRTLIDR